MTETVTAAEPHPPAHEDRMMAAIVYGLYLLGLTNGVTILIGLIIAYANLGAAGPKMRSHYIFQIRTVWIAVAWSLLAFLLIGAGAVLSFVLIGIPLFHLGWGMLGAGVGWLWYLVRSVAGALKLAHDESYPRPRAWLI